MVEALIVALAFVAGALSHWWFGRPKKITEDDVTAAVRQAYVSVGLPAEQFGPDFNLLHAGKLEQVYHLAARALGKDPAWDTVGDVIQALKE